ncbi:MAG TPA: clostripain-related cysteine peptidase, partial [Candidatus Wallbacteria bacterium]|nr:clostripain-related cysteine peptidase [Candidatus Wallbacteria bacterium]
MKESVKWGMFKKSLVVVTALIVVVLLSNVVFAAGHANESKAKAQWNFIVFLNGVNNLDTYGDKDVAEMKKIGSSADVNILVLQGHMSKPFQTLLIKKGSVEVINSGNTVDMGDYKELVKFVKWANDTYPAEHYLVDIWNHGAGWKNRDKKVFKGISYDDHSNNHMTTPQLGEAMKQIKAVIGHNVDVLGMDACLMQMMEVGYEVKDSVDFIAASEETEPGNGWPYDLV